MGDLVNGTIAMYLENIASTYPNKTAFIFPEENLRLTFEEVSRNAKKTAKALLASGLNRGDRIGIWSTNSSQWVSLLFGASYAGIMIVPMNTNFHETELKDACKDFEVNMLFLMPLKTQEESFVLNRVFQDGDQIREEYPCLKKIVTLGSGFDDFLDLGDQVDEEILDKVMKEVKAEDFYLIQLTSGTTSKPKGALLSQKNGLNTAAAYGKLLHMEEKDVTCVPLPLFHCFGNVLTLLGGVLSASTTIYLKAFSASLMLKILEEEKCTAMMGVPTMYFSMINAPNFKSYNFQSLVKAGIGGAYCSSKLAYKIEKAFEINGLTIGYGLSEGASLCTLSDVYEQEEIRLRSVGYPLPGLEVALADMDTGIPNDALRDGEIVVRGYSVMSGYYKKSEETKKVFDADGWLHTGDLGHIDRKGAFHIVGRLKDIIIRGGENISPNEVEEVLIEMNNVKACQCIGLPDEKYGEEVAVYLISQNGERITEEQVKLYLQSKIACYKIPKYVLMTNEFPINASGKIVKRELIKKAIDELGFKDRF